MMHTKWIVYFKKSMKIVSIDKIKVYHLLYLNKIKLQIDFLQKKLLKQIQIEIVEDHSNYINKIKIVLVSINI